MSDPPNYYNNEFDSAETAEIRRLIREQMGDGVPSLSTGLVNIAGTDALQSGDVLTVVPIGPKTESTISASSGASNEEVTKVGGPIPSEAPSNLEPRIRLIAQLTNDTAGETTTATYEEWNGDSFAHEVSVSHTGTSTASIDSGWVTRNLQDEFAGRGRIVLSSTGSGVPTIELDDTNLLFGAMIP